MERRIGVSATAVAVTSPITLAFFEVMGWKMPAPLAIAGITITVATGLIALAILVHGVWAWSKPLRAGVGLQFPTPLYWKNKSDPNQWLLDIALHDAENPQGELRKLSQWVTDVKFEEERRRPYLLTEFLFHNGGVHTVVLGPAKGRVKYNGDELQEEVEAIGRTRLERGAGCRYTIKVYVPREVAESLHREELSVEVARSFRRTRSLSFSGVTLQVESEPTEGFVGQVRQLSLGGDDTLLVGDTN